MRSVGLRIETMFPWLSYIYVSGICRCGRFFVIDSFNFMLVSGFSKYLSYQLQRVYNPYRPPILARPIHSVIL